MIALTLALLAVIVALIAIMLSRHLVTLPEPRKHSPRMHAALAEGDAQAARMQRLVARQQRAREQLVESGKNLDRAP